MTTDADLAGGRLTIDLGALQRNWGKLRDRSGAAECGAVVKADAYGCGIEQVVPALEKAGCRTFFVAVPQEGISLRAVAPEPACYILNGLFPKAAKALIENRLRPVLGSMNQLHLWADAARIHGAPLPCALHVDTGMNRLGLSLEELRDAVADQDLMAQLDVQLLMTHFACADDVDHPKTDVQRAVFDMAADMLPGVPRSAANSAASLQGFGYDLARPGVAMYGGEALNDVDNAMEVVVTLEGRINQIRTVKKGETVGYGATETMIRESRIAYLSLGYADGYHRAASHMGVPMREVAAPARAAYKGQRLKGVGRISMDLCAFDVTDVPPNEIAEGDWIELFGPNIAVDDVARAAGTIGYELLTGMGRRYSRRYVG
ncbi:MAG: alanine racemase [Ahrensia sp.]|nr:alanine racemase [Ahrensia sp.]